MATKKQLDTADLFLSELDGKTQKLFGGLIEYMLELGYAIHKEKSGLSFKSAKDKRQLAKMSIKTSKDNTILPSFALKFSASRSYSDRYKSLIEAYAAKYPSRTALCISGGCSLCHGEAAKHAYAVKSPDGGEKYLCGAYAIEIPNIQPGDLAELKGLIKEEHDYLAQSLAS